jgi:hypothetical protein
VCAHLLNKIGEGAVGLEKVLHRRSLGFIDEEGRFEPRTEDHVATTHEAIVIPSILTRVPGHSGGLQSKNKQTNKPNNNKKRDQAMAQRGGDARVARSALPQSAPLVVK